MKTNREYNDALGVIKENNLGLVDTIDSLSEAITHSHGLLFPEEPDARAFGVHPETQNNIMLFWRELFHKPNGIEVVSSVPKGDPEYSGTVMDPQMRMSIYLMTQGQQCLELGGLTPQDLIFGIVNREDPADRREDILLPALYSLAESAGIQRIFDYTVKENPFKTTVRRVPVKV